MGGYCYDVFGLLDTPCGLGTAAKNSIRVLEASGRRVELHSFGKDGLRAATPAADACSASINLFHLNPDWAERILLRRSAEELHEVERLNVAVPFWELPVLPKRWLSFLGAVDVVLAPTTFIGAAVHAALPGALVRPMPQAVHLPLGVVADRARFDLPEEATVFAFSFAADSSADRKNPLAAVRAFQAAFADAPEGVSPLLALRVNNAPDDLSGDPVLVALSRISAEDARIRLYVGPWEYQTVLSFYASADVYVSLHRSEGLGLGPMEAMSLGKPVIATAWSGNMDFMDGRNSWLVDYDLAPVDGGWASPYRAMVGLRGARWAEAKVDDAALAMRVLAEYPDLRRAIGGLAADDMAARREMCAKARFADALERDYETLVAQRPDRRDRLAGARHTAAIRRAMRVPYAIGTRLSNSARRAAMRMGAWTDASAG